MFLKDSEDVGSLAALTVASLSTQVTGPIKIDEATLETINPSAARLVRTRTLRRGQSRAGTPLIHTHGPAGPRISTNPG